ncbi:MAG: M23 family metallopeptidase [Nitriliruptoraceae bacterium]
MRQPKGPLRRLIDRASVIMLAGVSALVVGHVFGEPPGPVDLPPIEEPGRAMDATAAPSRQDWVDVAYERVELTPLFAMSGDVRLHVPSQHPLAVGFHEASADYSRPLTPVGRMLANRNPTRPIRTVDGERPGYLVLSSRGRPFASTSSVDVAMEVGDSVVSPVDGVVADVRDYLLYGRHRDTRIEIRPDDSSTAILVMLHVEGAEVNAGDRVVAGKTPVASSARLLPFASHIDRDVPGARRPHVHIEVRDPDSPRPDPLP